MGESTSADKYDVLEQIGIEQQYLHLGSEDMS